MCVSKELHVLGVGCNLMHSIYKSIFYKNNNEQKIEKRERNNENKSWDWIE